MAFTNTHYFPRFEKLLTDPLCREYPIPLAYMHIYGVIYAYMDLEQSRAAGLTLEQLRFPPKIRQLRGKIKG